ncbi:MAG TPA: metallophosphoesterase [Minicystis sp.]|nr:metallophosphoesterase [Minicystis sp.]
MQRSSFAFVLFFAIVTAVVGLIHFYLWSRLVRAPALDPSWQRAGGVAIAALAVATPVGIALARLLPRPASRVVAGVAYGWFGLATLLLFTLLATELVRAGVHAAAAMLDAPFDPERRTLLSRVIAGGSVALALGLGATGAAAALGEVAVRRVRVPLARLPKALSGFKVVQLSDLHIGPTLGAAWLADVVARTNALEPDLVVITGDLVDGSVEDLREQVAPLADLRAKHGVFFVTGNHEYYSGVDAWLSELARLGVRALRNEHVSIGDGDASFDLAGVDDLSAHRFGNGHGADLPRALAGRDRQRELLLLAHQPKQVLEAAEHGVGLQLSGHTHGGQIVPWNFFVRLDQPYIAGLARHRDTHVYVSRGTGFWGPPMRVGAPAEIALVELVTA